MATGDSYVSGTNLTVKFDKKAVGTMQNTYYTISNGVYGNGALAYNNITNSKTSVDATNYVNFISYTSANSPAQSTPKQVVEVNPKVIASNSHSIYKGAKIANATGYVSVGNGANGYESKVLENVLLEYDYVLTQSTAQKRMDTIPINSIIFVPDASLSIRSTYLPISGYIYRFLDLGVDTNATLEGFAYGYAPRSESLGHISIPQHSTISLDSTSNGAKWFEVISVDDNNQYCLDRYVEQMIYDTSWGDDDTFEQLTNGTITDLNGNTVKTLVCSTPLGIYKK